MHGLARLATLHDREVRARRIRRTVEKLLKLQAAVAAGRLQGERPVAARAERIFRDGKAVHVIRWELRGDRFTFGLDLAYLHAQRRRDGIFVLVTNDLSLSTDEVVRAYRQRYRVERAFRVLKSLTKLRPIYHHASRRAHVFLRDRRAERGPSIIVLGSSQTYGPVTIHRMPGCQKGVRRGSGVDSTPRKRASKFQPVLRTTGVGD